MRRANWSNAFRPGGDKGAFKTNAGTEVILRRRAPGEALGGPDWRPEGCVTLRALVQAPIDERKVIWLSLHTDLESVARRRAAARVQLEGLGETRLAGGYERCGEALRRRRRRQRIVPLENGCVFHARVPKIESEAMESMTEK
ncbi:hypothetical protein [Rhodomicrobium lacus]|uniref:hypothetical protein n=1 Tax=Rhodomicrobium lacus TaxID=2498452 RepID=UPI0026E2B22B|nr:hypothetical protein [Rhodomicrobium lacus]WKW52071.1 hypothetical protein QMO75_06220 [Rhodomicrobium lacus]